METTVGVDEVAPLAAPVYVETGNAVRDVPREDVRKEVVVSSDDERARMEARLVRWMHALAKEGVAPARREFLDAAGVSDWEMRRLFGKYAALARRCGYALPGARKRRTESVFGAPLEGYAMTNAPTNEQDVVMLFGMMARELGFEIELVRTAFPDCEAKRRCGDGRWRRVRIEFEYESCCFDHDPAGCDLIVCWKHNAKKGDLEVLELRSELERRKRQEMVAGASTVRARAGA